MNKERSDILSESYNAYLKYEAVKNEIFVLNKILEQKKQQLKSSAHEVHQHREQYGNLCNMIYKGREKKM